MANDHPAWCDRAECSIGLATVGTHYSHPTVLERGPGGLLGAAVRVMQGASSQVFVELSFDMPSDEPDSQDEEVIIPLSPKQATVLARIIATAGRVAAS
jgi:hypothetical protein